MTTRLLVGILVLIASSSLVAENKEPVYVGIDAKGARHPVPDSGGNAPWMRDLAHAVMPTVSPAARTDWYEGVGIFRLTLDPTTGATREVTILRTTGHVAFDRRALLALKVWRWKPGTWAQVDIPMYFQRGGGVLVFPRYTTLRVRE
jgi:TonB family protein